MVDPYTLDSIPLNMSRSRIVARTSFGFPADMLDVAPSAAGGILTLSGAAALLSPTQHFDRRAGAFPGGRAIGAFGAVVEGGRIELTKMHEIPVSVFEHPTTPKTTETPTSTAAESYRCRAASTFDRRWSFPLSKRRLRHLSVAQCTSGIISYLIKMLHRQYKYMTIGAIFCARRPYTAGGIVLHRSVVRIYRERREGVPIDARAYVFQQERWYFLQHKSVTRAARMT